MAARLRPPGGSGNTDWYVWADDPSQPPGAGHRSGDRFYLGLFWEGMPDLDPGSAAVTADLYDVANFWLDDMGETPSVMFGPDWSPQNPIPPRAALILDVTN